MNWLSTQLLAKERIATARAQADRYREVQRAKEGIENRIISDSKQTVAERGLLNWAAGGLRFIRLLPDSIGNN